MFYFVVRIARVEVIFKTEDSFISPSIPHSLCLLYFRFSITTSIILPGELLIRVLFPLRHLLSGTPVPLVVEHPAQEVRVLPTKSTQNELITSNTVAHCISPFLWFCSRLCLKLQASVMIPRHCSVKPASMNLLLFLFKIASWR